MKTVPVMHLLTEEKPLNNCKQTKNKLDIYQLTWLLRHLVQLSFHNN